MNRAGVLQSSPVQQMMAAGNPNWWNINAMRPPTQPVLPSPSFLYPQFIPTTTTTTTATTTTTTTTSNSSSSSSANSSHHELHNIPSWAHDNNQDQLPESWSQLLLGGLAVGEEEKANNMMSHFQVKKLENWEDHHPHHHQQMLSSTTQASNASVHMVDHVKQENSAAYVYGHGSQEFQAKPGGGGCGAWLSHQHQIMVANNSNSSPKSSCVTSFSSNMLDFSNISKADHHTTTHPPLLSDRSSECNSTATGGAPLKKARVQPSSAQTTFKVRKEKLGDRITALHQLVSPFGKTDTASVLLEAIGYIRFLQSQIEALSLPYLGSGSGNMRQQQSVHGEGNCMFPEDPGQLLNDNCMKRKGAPDQQDSLEEPRKDLRSRGLCLVPVSCTLQVGSDNGADYWAPALGGGAGGGFR